MSKARDFVENMRGVSSNIQTQLAAKRSSSATINNSDWSGTDLEVAKGGTGASSAGAARTNLDIDQAGTNLPKSGGAMTGAITTNSTFDGRDVAADGVTADAALPKAGGAMTGAITTNSTFDGRDVAADGVTADAALPKAGGAMTGAITTNSTFDGVDIAVRDAVLTSTTTTAGNANTLAAAALPKAGGTMSGLVNMADNIIQRPVLKDYAETKVAMSAYAADMSLGNVFTKTMSGNQTFTFTNPPASGTAGSFTLLLTNGGSATATWPTSVDWPAATAPTLTASGVDVLTFVTIDGGTIWYGVASGIGMA